MNPTPTVSFGFVFVDGSDFQLRILKQPDPTDVEPDDNFKRTKGTIDLQAIDQVEEDFQEYSETRDNWPGYLGHWDEWVELLGDFFRIIDEKSLTIEGNQARGTVSALVGLNYVIVALIEDGCIRYFGEGEVRTEAGETSHLHLSVVENLDWPCM
jgi:hypothetical protein